MASPVEDEIIDDVIDDILEHHGVKGMHWGFRQAKKVVRDNSPFGNRNSRGELPLVRQPKQIRKDNAGKGQKASPRKIRRLDKKFEKTGNPSGSNPRKMFLATIEYHNKAAAYANARLHTINDKPAYKGKDFSRDTPLRRKYYKEHQNLFLAGLDKAAKEAGTNASGTRQRKLFETANGGWEIHTVDIKHAGIDEDAIVIRINVERDLIGHIVKLTVANPESPVQHGELVVSHILSHHGVKGMHWGVRSGRGGLSKSQFKRKFKGHKSKKKKTAARLSNMSDSEVRKRINRINMEKQYTELNKESNAGKDTAKFIAKIGVTAVTAAATAAATRQVAKGLSSAGTKMGAKKAAKGAAKAAAKSNLLR